jgi:hypothetical protein
MADSGGMTIRDAQAITTWEVARLFKASFKRGPWPSESDCAVLAARLDLVRRAHAAVPVNLPSVPDNLAAKAARDLLHALPERERYWRAKRSQSTPAAAALAANFMPGAEAALADLRGALERALLYLDFPPTAVSRKRRKDWTSVAFGIASLAVPLLYRAGRRRVRVNNDCSLVAFVMSAMERLGVEVPKHEAVASALGRIPGLLWLIRQGDAGQFPPTEN